MRAGWKKYRLGELCQITSSKRIFSNEYVDSGIPFYRSKEIIEKALGEETSDLLYISMKKFNEIKNKFGSPREGELLLSSVGNRSGIPYFVKDEGDFYFKDGNLTWFKDFHKNLYSQYLYYWIKSTIGQNSLNAIMIGSAQKALTIVGLSNLSIILPSIQEQKTISSILSALDDKIELNRQTNQTLEAIAQAIFKEWFVDFRFPHSPLEGWQAKPDGVESSLRPCPTGGVDSLQAKPASLSSWQKNSLFPFWALPKNHKLQERAKELRKQGILSEVVFWKAFKDKKKLGWDIDRQVIIGNFIVDFFIPELGLVFEIDGSSHNDKQEYDQERDAFLSSLQLKVVRISDKDVLRNIEGVWSFVTESIKDRVEELEEKSPPRPSGTPQEGNKCEMQDSELGPIPKGWRVGRLGEEGDFKNGVNYSRDDNGDSEFAIVNVRNVVENKFLDKQALDTIHIDKKKALPYLLEADDILIVRSASPGESAILLQTERNIIYSGFTIRYRLNNKKYFLYLFYIFQNLKQSLYNLSNGTTLKNINQEMLRPYQVILPDEKTINAFNNIVESIFDEIQNINHQSAALAAIRDLLLPKLMNGEIEV